MKNKIETSSGTALLVGSLLMVVTMSLHPVGGNFEHLLRISSAIIITHSIALVTVPMILFGFWGLTKRLNNNNVFSIAAFITISLGVFAAICALVTNGLALPLFLNNFRNSPPEVITSIKPILLYNIALNSAFDLIFIGAACGAVILWSFAILRTRQFPKWVGYFGIIAGLSAIIALVAGFVFVNLTGFRIFILCFVAWTAIIGFLLRKEEKI